MATVFQNREKYIIYLTSRVEGFLVLKGLFGTVPLPFFQMGQPLNIYSFCNNKKTFYIAGA